MNAYYQQQMQMMATAGAQMGQMGPQAAMMMQQMSMTGFPPAMGMMPGAGFPGAPQQNMGQQ